MSSMSSSTTESSAAAPAGGSAAPAAQVAKARVPLFTAEAWAPLKVDLFRSLWVATLIAQIGTWAREAAGPALMANLTNGLPTKAEWVGRVLVFSNLPICLFSVFAGALADVLDRRQVLIVTQIWMVVVSALLGLFTLWGIITPWGLLGLTFLLGTGTAAFGPALQAVLPELVPKQHFSLAINMNSIALNLARALGPAMFIIVVYAVFYISPHSRGMTGENKAAGIAFLLTALSFVGAVWVLWKWERPPQRAAVHGEEMWNSISAGFRYTVHSPANRAILLRVLTFIVPATVIWGQVPIIAAGQLHMRGQQEANTALIFMFVGMGAIFGVFLMPGLHGRYRIDPVVNVCTALFALGLIVLSVVHTIWIAAFILIFLGFNWVIIPTNFNTATQKSVPPWVKGRAISFYLTVLFGSFAIGGALWGRVTTHASIHVTLLLGGVSMAAFLLLAFWYPLTLNEGIDLSPADAAALKAAGPDLPAQIDPAAGPIDVSVDYEVHPDKVREFAALQRRLREVRRRCGAARWTLRTVNDAQVVRFTERYRFANGAEYQRYPARMTKADAKFLDSVRALHSGSNVTERHVDPADWPSSGQVLQTRMLAQLEISFNRALDEVENAVERFAALRSRAKKSPRGLRITIELPRREDHAQ